MNETHAKPFGLDPVAVLFHPTAVPVIDVFRSIDSLDDQYDLTLLDGPERALAAYVRPGVAKGIVSDALLLAFALSRQRARAFDHRPLHSRSGSRDEYGLLALIGASRRPGFEEVAREASTFLEVAPLDLLSALAGELARQIDLGSIVFPMPSLGEFRAVIGVEARGLDILVETFGKPERHLGL